MMFRSLAVAALTLAGSGVACAQSVSIYVSPGATVYVTPSPNGYYNGAPAVYPGPYGGPYAPPAPVVATPYGYPAEVAPQVYVAPGPGYGNGYAPGYGNGYAPTYDAPLSAYGAAPGVVVGPRRVWVEEPPRPPAPVPYGRWRGW